MRPSKIRAVDRVVRDAAIGLAEALRWFYVDVAGLEEVDPDPDRAAGPGAATLHFRAARQELQIRLVPNPVIESAGFPIVIAVASLDEASELLGARSVACETISGIGWPDRRLATNDPAGNRVDFKREWPYDPL
jgi:catechol 2,3-dioxygenase-like lactoylglutathione lyase family enzyme